MTARLPLSRRALPRAVVLAVCAALIPLPILAAGPASGPKPADSPSVSAPESRPLRRAIEKLDARQLEPKTTPSPSAARRSDRSDQVGDTAKQSSAFFKTGPGIAVLAVIAAGVGYALYSTSHDRINSPGKQ